MFDLASILPVISGAVSLTTELVKGYRVFRHDKTRATASTDIRIGSITSTDHKGPTHQPNPATLDDKEQLRHASQFEQMLLQYNRCRDLEFLRGQLRLAVDRQLLREQYVADQNPVRTYPGSWLQDTFGVLPPAPLILFNPHLALGSQGVEPAFNPLQTLFEQCQHQNASLCADVTVTSFGSRPFRANDEISQFYHRELSPLPAIIVTGHFDGHAFLVQASAFGLEQNQISWTGSTVRIGSKTVSLGRIPLQGLEDELTVFFQSQHPAGPSDGLIKSQVREAIVAICDLTINTSLRLLVEHYFGFRPQFEFTPRLCSSLKQKLSSLQLPLTSFDALLASVSRHEKELLAFRTFLGRLHSQFDTEDSNHTATDVGDMSVLDYS